jgi:hypothetical protein
MKKASDCAEAFSTLTGTRYEKTVPKHTSQPLMGNGMESYHSATCAVADDGLPIPPT